MLEFLTNSVIQQGVFTLGGTLLCTAASLILGLGIAAVYMFRNKYTQSFVMALALLPVIVQIVIMMVNGNIGAGVAVAGAFSLVRFRSAPGSAKDIVSIFFAMAIGLATGMGYLFYAGLFFIVIGAAQLVLACCKFGAAKQDVRALRIIIPENLDYDNLFDDLFAQYTDSAELDRVKTTNMGSLYELSYNIVLKSPNIPKALIDALRCRNGNLNIIISRPQTVKDEL